MTNTNYPLPTRPTDGSAVYELNDGSTAQVSRKADGSFYCAAEDFDSSAKDATEMAAKLQSFGGRYIGWERSR